MALCSTVFLFSGCFWAKNNEKQPEPEYTQTAEDALEKGERFSIQVAGERIYVPADAAISIEHERSDDAEEVEFQLKWEL